MGREELAGASSISLAAIWLSLHPPHFHNNALYLQKLFALESTFVFVDAENAPMTNDIISYRVMSDEQKPAWGADWGNFFEVGLLPRKHFQMDGEVYSRSSSKLSYSAQTAA